MSAVDLSILNNRIQSLQLYRSDPEIYLHKLEDLLNLYSTEKIKLGETIALQTLLPQKNVPNLVLEKVVETFPSLTQDFPENVIFIIDLLWKREELEFKLLAIRLLLCLPAERTDEISKRLPQWIASTDEEILHQAILTQLPLSHKNTSPNIQSFIERLIQTEDAELRRLAFCTLARVIEQKYFFDLPWVFSLLTPFLEDASIKTYGMLNPVITVLIKKSEIEAVSFFHDIYCHTGSLKAKKYIRKITPLFTPENQKYLIEVLQKE